MSVAVLGLGLVLLRCGSSDEPGGSGSGGGGAAGAGTAGAGGGHAGSNTAGAPHAGSGTAGGSTAGSPAGGAAGASEAGAGGDDIGAGGDDIGAGGAPVELTLGFVLNSQILPTPANPRAVDLDGNGVADNAYQALVTGLTNLGYPEQSVADAESAAGRGLQLARLTVKDSNLVQSAGTILDLARAVTHASPDFGGSGTFAVDGTALSATLPGAIAAGAVTTTAVQIGEKPQKVLLRLPFAVAVDVPVSVFSVSAHVAATGLTVGQLNGAIAGTDVDALVPPAIAAQVNTVCPATDTSATCLGVWNTLDVNHDKSVSAEEVRTNSLLKSLLASDVKLFDALGKYAPNPTSLTKDSLSVGIGFTAVKAIITQ